MASHLRDYLRNCNATGFGFDLAGAGTTSTASRFVRSNLLGRNVSDLSSCYHKSATSSRGFVSGLLDVLLKRHYTLHHTVQNANEVSWRNDLSFA